MNIIENNPYRLLGVYANSSTKERLANLNRMKAFLKVGKPVSFPLDLPQFLPPVSRSEESLADAVARLTLPNEQMLYAQFWFVRATSIDEVAFKHLLAGDLVSAEKIWLKKEDAFSLQNRTVCALLKGDYVSALSCANTLYNNVSYVRRLKLEVVGEDGNVKVEDMLWFFLDALSEEVGGSTLLPYITSAKWRKHVEDKVVKPLMESIENAINEAQKSKGKGSRARYASGAKLCKETKSALMQLKKMLPASNLQYQMIADKLALGILQCGIDYYNDSDEPDAALKAMKLQGYANSIVVGQVAKERCQKNVEILQKAVNNLPPTEVYAEDKAMELALATFRIQPKLIRSSIALIRNCAPHVVAIKEKLGNAHPYYLKISTIIVNSALENVISEVNDAQEKDFETLKATLIEAWHAQLYMDKFDLETEYKEGRFKQSRDALHSIISECKGFENRNMSFMYKYGCGWCNNINAEDVDLRTDDEFYSSCLGLTPLRRYTKRFPSGKHIAEAKIKIERFCYQECKTIADFQKFTDDFPHSPLVSKARENIYKIRKEEERKEKITRQEIAISICLTTDDVITLYEREKTARIDPSSG